MNLGHELRMHLGLHVAHAGYIQHNACILLHIMVLAYRHSFFLVLAYRHSTSQGGVSGGVAFLVQLRVFKIL